MSELIPCPFCGWEFAEHAWNEFGEEYRVCDQCGASSGTVDSKWDWQSRPIEDALQARIAELEAAQRWRVVADGELPDDRATVLVAFTEYPEQIDILTATYYKRYEGFGGVDNWWDIEGWHSGNVTHWMPLPKPPEVQQ